MALKKSQLYSSLWQSCDELRGGMDVARSYSRPRVSNDNPYSESHFKTLKYTPDCLGRFADPEQARTWTRSFLELPPTPSRGPGTIHACRRVPRPRR